MDIREFKEKVFEKARKEGFSDFEIYYSKNESLSINIYKTEVDKYSVNDSMGISFRGIYNGKMGYSYTEIIDDKSIDMLVLGAKASALSIENEDEELIYGEKEEYKILSGLNEQSEEVSAEDKIQFALDVEKEAFDMDSRVANIAYCAYEEEAFEYGIMNSKGIDLNNKQKVIASYIVPVVKAGDLNYDGMAFKFARNFKDLNAKELSKEAVENALARIGGDSIPSGNYKIVLKNDVMATLIATFSSIFNAEDVQKGMSLLKGKVGQSVAAPIVNLVDNPHMEDGLYSTPFDAEGVATYEKHVIKDGVLNTFLYNLKAAKKDGVKSTGNASKSSYASPVNISFSNCYIEKGKKSYDQLLKEAGDAVLITDLEGLHAGANAITGDFSLAAKGFSIKDGKVGAPIEQITVAGNFFKLLMDIEQIAEDLKFTFPMGGYFGSPSVMVKELSVAGK